ncbi:hypothetical protein BH09PSE3_BH09PSE3_23500 [soil metagenome]
MLNPGVDPQFIITILDRRWTVLLAQLPLVAEPMIRSRRA